MYFNTEASKRLIQMNPSCSQSTFRDSTKNALQAQKHQDGTLRINTPYQERQTQQKVANLKQKLTQLTNMSSSVRCQSNLNNTSSAASVTAATSYLPTTNNYNRTSGNHHGATGVDQSGKQSGYNHFRPNSNISNLISDSRTNLGDRHQKTFITDLTRFSQNSVSKDLSPLRKSQLKTSSLNPAIKRTNPYQYGNKTVQQDSRKYTTTSSHNFGQKTAVAEARRSGVDPHHSPLAGAVAILSDNKQCSSQKNNNRRSRNSQSSRRDNVIGGGRAASGGTRSICRSASFPRANSIHSMRTNQSSPERLVNIVCPPSKDPKNRRNGQRIAPSASGSHGHGGSKHLAARPRSDMRHSLYQNQNSFVVTEGGAGSKKERSSKQKLMKQLQALGNSYGLNGLSASSQSQFMSTKLLGIQLSKKAIETPSKHHQRKDSHHLAEDSRMKSRSHSRLEYCKSAHKSSTPGMSTKKKSLKKFNSKIAKLSNADKRKLVKSRRSISRNSLRSRSAQSMNRRDSNSNMIIKENNNASGVIVTESLNNRDERRVGKYLKHQKNSSSVKKQFNFASIEAQNTLDQSLTGEPHQQKFSKPPSGQVTGKFRSLNEPILNQMAAFKQFENGANYKPHHYPAADHKQRQLITEDDYCETLTETASSEESPMRPSQRVQRAAALTTKAYLDEVNQRVEKASIHAQSIKEFGPRKMKVAYQQINERQGARLQCLKQQMQESLIETHQLQAKLQNSSTYEQDSHKRQRLGVSQFNSLVLEFSQNLENKATEMIEATESKRRNARMKDMIAELQEMRNIRSGSKSVPNSARRHHHRSSLQASNQKSARKLRSRSKSSAAKSEYSRGGDSSRSNRSGRRSCSGKKSLKRHQRSKSQKSSRRLRRSKSKSARRGLSKSARSARSLSKSARSARSATSMASSRGRSRSRKKIKSVKRNIFKQTNGFRDIEQTIQNIRQRPLRSRSRTKNSIRSKSKSKISTRSRSKSVKSRLSNGRSLSNKLVGRRSQNVKQLGQKCEKLMGHRFNGSLDIYQKKQLKRSISKRKKSGVSKSQSKSKQKSKPRSKSAKKQRKNSMSKSPVIMSNKSKQQQQQQQRETPDLTPKITPQVTPCMTPLHKILRNSMGDPEISDMAVRSGQMAVGGTGGRFGSMAANQNKKVKICSRRLQDITQLTSSDSDSSYDSEDSMDHEKYLKRQQAHLSPWQRACIRKQLPKKFR